MKIKHLIPALFIALLTSCGGDEPSPEPDTPTTPPAEDTDLPALPFARGADVSWVTEEEANGAKWYNSAGEEEDIFHLLKTELGVNAIRLRVWVNPANGYNGLEDVLVKARRAHALGLMLMIDFHLSDSWADPGKQNPPAAWAGYGIDEMTKAVDGHIRQVLSALKEAGIEPQWVQVGNETRNGLLWPLGQADINALGFVKIINAGYDAVKAVVPDARVIVHLDCGDVQDYYTYIFGILQTYGGRYDMIGMSLYPTTENWPSAVTAIISNINACWSRWRKPSMICEVGMHWEAAEACEKMLSALIDDSRNDTAGHGRGVFYWEPQSTPGYNGGYDKGAFTPDGKATSALHAFKHDADNHPND